LDRWTPDQQPDELSPLDRWILSKLHLTLIRTTEAQDNYDTMTACNEIDKFVDTLSKWYVRRSRRRFWKTEADDEKRAAYSTLYQCLKTVIYMMAPVTPHLSEALYQRMVRPVEPNLPESVHHCKWPEPDEGMLDEELTAEMDLAMSLSSMGRAARSQANIKLRQPLSEAVVVVPDAQLARLDKVSELVREELNVKKLKFSTDRGLLQSLTVSPQPSKLGRKHGRLFPKVATAVKALGSVEARALSDGNPVTVIVDGDPIEVLPEEVELVSVPHVEYSVVDEGGLLVGVHTVISGDLEAEGLARDIVRRVQALRKDADFEIDDRIITYYKGSPEVEEVFEDEADYIKAETLSDRLVRGEAPEDTATKEYEIDGLRVILALLKI
jgi:isoleucyl-tRNA synthetase